MNKKLMLIVATAISGAISGYILPGAFSGESFIEVVIVQYGPGILFGLATGVVFFAMYKLHPLRCLLWLAVSIGSWYAALQLYVGLGAVGGTFVMLAAGGLGSLLLGLASIMLVRRDGLPVLPLVVIVGALAGGGMWAILNGEDPTRISPNSLSWILAFVLWHVGVGLALVSDLPPFLRRTRT